MIDIARVPIARIKPIHRDASTKILNNIMRPEIYQAADNIIALGGDADRRCDYMVDSRLYIGIEVVMQLLFPDRTSLTGLQLASNYGPYLHYLKHELGLSGITGVDLNRHAVQYAEQIGSMVRLGNAIYLDVADSSLDVVITRHFIDLDYLVCPTWVVRGQIHRVLKPGGIHISDKEALTWDPYQLANPMFSQQTFSAEVKKEFFELEEVYVFQKAA